MLTKAYTEYIKSERWKRKREQAFIYYGRKCYACRKAPKVLHIHHLTYKNLGNERMADLRPLCVPCHKEVTRRYRKNRRRGLMRVTLEFIQEKRKQIYKG